MKRQLWMLLNILLIGIPWMLKKAAGTTYVPLYDWFMSGAVDIQSEKDWIKFSKLVHKAYGPDAGDYFWMNHFPEPGKRGGVRHFRVYCNSQVIDVFKRSKLIRDFDSYGLPDQVCIFNGNHTQTWFLDACGYCNECKKVNMLVEHHTVWDEDDEDGYLPICGHCKSKGSVTFYEDLKPSLKVKAEKVWRKYLHDVATKKVNDDDE